MTAGGVRSAALMGTIVTIEVAGESAGDSDSRERSIDRAFSWFREIERICSRFEPESELNLLSSAMGTPVVVSQPLFEALAFALAVAEDTDGAFDPTIGRELEQLGFDRNHRSGAVVAHNQIAADRRSSWRDVTVDAENRSVTLRRPLVLDLGAVAKGLAVDLAARELQPHSDFAIDAGGDLYLGGLNPEGLPWSVGIRDPRDTGNLLASAKVSNLAVCTSGNYERSGKHGARHLLDPRLRRTADAAASATVVAPSTMVADALATAAFVLGPEEGLALLRRHGVEGLIVSPDFEVLATEGFPHE